VYARVRVCGRSFRFDNIMVSESLGASYKIGPDSHYSIEAQFRSGRRLRREDKYVTSGMNFTHEIAIGDSSVSVILRRLE